MSAVAELMDSGVDATAMIYSVKVLASEGDAAERQRPSASPHWPR